MSKNISIRLQFFLFVTLSANGQTLRSPVTATYLTLSAYSNMQKDVFSFQGNQAALAGINKASIGVYGEKRYLLKELSLYNLSAVVPTHSGNFGLKAGYFGFADYNETEAGLAYGRCVGSKVDVGVEFNYYMVKVTGYGNATAINFEISSIFHLTEKLNAGIHVFNPVGGKLGKNQEEKLASKYAIGVGYDASEKFFTAIEIEKEENKPVNVNAGIQYKFLEQLIIRAGMAASIPSIYFGVGYVWKSTRLDATASYHQQLGITPGLLLLFNFNKKEN